MQTVTLTLEVPDKVAEWLRALPADKNHHLVAALLDAAEEDEEDAPLPPLPPLLAQPLSEALRKGFEAADAGHVTDGETFLADLRRHVGRE